MDIEGDAVWKWYGSTPSDTNRASGRSASFSGVEAFLSYAANNTGYGLVAAADAPYYTGQPGDIIHMGNDDGYKHTVLIVDTVKDENGQTIDYLIDSNTADLRNFPVSAYAYTRQMLIAIQGWND